MSATFWDLCSDELIELCKYFSLNELFFSFYPDVIPHLFELLTHSHSNLHLCLTNDTQLTMTILSLIYINRIKSLQMSSNDIPLNIFPAVKSIIFNCQPHILPSSLERLILVYSRNINHLVEHALRRVFSHPSLEYLQLNLTNDYLLPPRNALGQSFSIKQLVVNASCSQSTLRILFNSLPYLRILRLRTLMEQTSTTNSNRVGHPNPLLPVLAVQYHSSLEIIELVWYHPNLANIKMLLEGLSNLKRCRLSGTMDFKELHGKSWHHLITKTCSNLTRMSVNMLIWSGTEIEEIKINFSVDTFFKLINFKLYSSAREEELLTLIGDVRRFVE